MYLIGNLHQTTTLILVEIGTFRCILLGIYIKPQQYFDYLCSHIVVSYWESTSNHNTPSKLIDKELLYLIGNLHQTTTKYNQVIVARELYLIGNLHQTTTRPLQILFLVCCILLGIYIKPQPVRIYTLIFLLLQYIFNKKNVRLHSEEVD